MARTPSSLRSGSAGADVTLTTGANGALVLSSGPLAGVLEFWRRHGQCGPGGDLPHLRDQRPGPGQSVTIQPVSIRLGDQSRLDHGRRSDRARAARTWSSTGSSPRRMRIGSTSNPGDITVSSPDHARGRHQPRCRCAPAAPSSTARPGSRRTSPSTILRAADRCWQLGHPATSRSPILRSTTPGWGTSSSTMPAA